MKIPSFAPLVAVALCAAALTGPTLRAQAYYDIHLDTSALIANSAGPFYLDFQLNDGAGLGNNDNTAVLSAFDFHGGAALTDVNAFGGATGDLASTVTLHDSSFLNEFFQSFTPGQSLDFHLTLSTTVDTPTPDLFVFSILDRNTFTIATTAASDALIEITIDGLTPSLQTYAGDVAGGGIALDAPSIAAVPEPATYGLIAAGAFFAAALWRRRALRVASA